MAEIQTHPGENGLVTAVTAQESAKMTSTNQKRGPSIHQIYALPAPIRTFPLPAFYPSNPISLFAVAYAWIRQVVSPPPAEPAVVHQGVWDEATGSVHITDEKSVRALWEQGFYGKGSLSRSEPNWLKRELVRRGQQKTHVSEILTTKRREERAQAKWERAKLEQEAIRQTRLKEAQLAATASQPGPMTSPPPSCASVDVPVKSVAELPRPFDSESGNIVARFTTEGINHGLAGSNTTVEADAPVRPVELPRPFNSESGNIVARFTTEGINHGLAGSNTTVEADAPVRPVELPCPPKPEADGMVTRSTTEIIQHSPASASATAETDAPVGPLELLRLPNSEADRVARSTMDGINHRFAGASTIVEADTLATPVELLRLPNSGEDIVARCSTESTNHSLIVMSETAETSAPVGPLELLRLPNSEADRVSKSTTDSINNSPIGASATAEMDALVGSLELLRLSNSEDGVARSSTESTNHSLIVMNETAETSAPVGPLELLRLPNSEADRVARFTADGTNHRLAVASAAAEMDTLVEPCKLPCLPNSKADNIVARSTSADGTNHSLTGTSTDAETDATLLSSDMLPSNTDSHVRASEDATTVVPTNGNLPVLEKADHQSIPAKRSLCDATEEKSPRPSKTVRFSPKVDSTTFNLADPPSPCRGENGVARELPSNGHVNGLSPPTDAGTSAAAPNDGDGCEEDLVVDNMEHLQLTTEESFFLTFGLGALSVSKPGGGGALSNEDMLTLFRQHSYFPPRIGPDEAELQPDDGFLVHYAVYHHFRSLGWVPRAGIKFGVDWLLYTRGPVFDHAEFGLIVIPSYSDEWWKERGMAGPEKTWHWLHGVVRVLSHVIKSLVLVYVDIPPPAKFDAALESGYAEALKLYRVREVMVKRWSSNRNR